VLQEETEQRKQLLEAQLAALPLNQAEAEAVSL